MYAVFSCHPIQRPEPRCDLINWSSRQQMSTLRPFVELGIRLPRREH
jgi:hypothetical protein